MSRMSKYLCQSAVIEIAEKDEYGKVLMDEYGNIKYHDPVTVKCRKEPYVAKYTTASGQSAPYKTTYYFDESVTPSIDDRLDGSLVLNVSEYRDGVGSLVGYEVDV